MAHRFLSLCLYAFLVFVAGCSRQPTPEPSLAAQSEEEKPFCIDPEENPDPQVEEGMVDEDQPVSAQDGVIRSATQQGVRRDRALCYKLQPGVPLPGNKKKKGAAVVGCCQPQSLIYARCRSGIETCRLGDTSPVQWFSCAKKSGNTTAIPATGDIMVLDGNARRKMPTGHPLYVENARKNGNGTWLLRVSHTNYDRLCHLDQDAEVIYDPSRMTVSFKSGPWSCWCHDMKILGFIVR